MNTVLDLGKAEQFWQQYLAGLARHELRASSAKRDGATQRLQWQLDARQSRALRQFGGGGGGGGGGGAGAASSVYAVCLALLQVLLARYTQNEDVCVAVLPAVPATATATAGHWQQALPLRCHTGLEQTFEQVWQQTGAQLLALSARQELPLDAIVQIWRNASQSVDALPFQLACALQTNAGVELEAAADADLTLIVQDCGAECITLIWDCRAPMLAGAWLQRLTENYVCLLQAALAAPTGTRIADLALLGAGEQALLRQHCELTPVRQAWREASLPQMISHWATHSGDAIALRWQQQTLTYRQFERRANAVAQQLQAAGVQPGDCVGIAVPRSLSQMIGYLGIMQAGAAYVPLEANLPASRLQSMITDCAMRFCLHDISVAQVSPALAHMPISLLAMDAMQEAEPITLARELQPLDACYVLFSSGSTGTPKGIACHHRGVIRLAFDETDLHFDANTVSLCSAAMAFDGATVEIWPPLLHGGQCVLYPDTVLDATILQQMVKEHGINSMLMTPALFAALAEVDPGCFNGITQLMVGGDVLPPDVVQAAYDACPQLGIVNGYGPTENTVFTTNYRVPRGAARDTRLPIGRRLSYDAVLMLDQFGNPMPWGMVGELAAFGDGVALGYMNKPELTAERFVAHPLAREFGKLYRSGDLARFQEDGLIDFLGRRDFQVKVNGFRVELDEIVSALQACSQVKQALVRARADGKGGKVLVAYYVLHDQFAAQDDEHISNQIRAQLAQSLPSYAMPRHLLRLSAVPLNNNGKIAEGELPMPQVTASADSEAPATGTEVQVAQIWCEVAGLPRIGRDDHFFALGGHSLLAVRIVGRINLHFHTGLTVRSFLQAATVRQLALLIDTRGEDQRQRHISRVAQLPTLLPLSYAQRSLWLTQQANPGSSVYNVPIVWRISGGLDLPRLAAALQQLVTRHASLRSVILEQDGTVLQQILPESQFAPQIQELADEAALQQILQQEAQRAFDLAAPPFIARILRLAQNEHVLLLNMHHIVVDGWSAKLMLQEIGMHYQGQALPELPLRYADYCLWQNSPQFAQEIANGVQYWRETLQDAPAVLHIANGVSRPAVASEAGCSLSLAMPAALRQAVAQFARSRECSENVVLLTAWQALLQRYAQCDDVVVGTPAANRHATELEAVIGYFVNPLPLRSRFTRESSFASLLAQTNQHLHEALEVQATPFEAVVAALQPARSLSYSPLFQVMFDYRQGGDAVLDLPGLHCAALSLPVLDAKYDLMLSVIDAPQQLELELNYRSQLFSADMMAEMLENYLALLARLLAQPDLPLCQQVCVSKPQALLACGQGNRMATASHVLQAIAQQVQAQPEAIAIAYEGQQISYRALWRQSVAIARHLRQQQVGSGDVVVLLMQRAPQMVASMLAVWQLGAAYLPLETSYPVQRLAYVLQDADARMVLADARGMALLQQLPQLPSTPAIGHTDLPQLLATLACPATAHDDMPLPDCEYDLQALAYLIYTSGSTGQPKGVMIAHAALANHMHWMQQEFGFHAQDRIFFKTPSGFDASVWEVYAPLMAGACMVIAGGDAHKDVQMLNRLLHQEAVTVAQFVPSLLQACIEDQEMPASLRYVFCGGEALPLALAQDIARRQAVLVNLYGPTEATIDSTFWRNDIHLLPEQAQTVPIGRPIANAACVVLDQQQQLLPLGCEGELYIAGSGLARAYRHLPEQTAARFVSLDLGHGGPQRYYRSGDLVRFAPDGQLMFGGRCDAQIKMRGFRIELGEIEALLLQQVKEAVVLHHVQGSQQEYLLAFVVLHDNAAPTIEESIWQALRQSLPDYMLPSVLQVMPAMPRTANGKVDRATLLQAAVLDSLVASEQVVRAASTDLEREIAQIWQQALELSVAPAVNVNFFQLGGHSLAATRLVSRVNRHFALAAGRQLGLREFLLAPTVENMARQVALQMAPALEASTATNEQDWRAGLQMQDTAAKPSEDTIVREEFTL